MSSVKTIEFDNWVFENLSEIRECRPDRGWNAYTFEVFCRIRFEEKDWEIFNGVDWNRYLNIANSSE